MLAAAAILEHSWADAAARPPLAKLLMASVLSCSVVDRCGLRRLESGGHFDY